MGAGVVDGGEEGVDRTSAADADVVVDVVVMTRVLLQADNQRGTCYEDKIVLDRDGAKMGDHTDKQQVVVIDREDVRAEVARDQ